MHTIFFSVSSGDIKFAEEVWSQFRSDLIYLYSKTGRLGADFWIEIERDELPNAQAIVIFWSWSFVRGLGTQREIALAAKMFRAGQLRSALILRLDGCPLKVPSAETDPAVVRSFADLEPFLSVIRASEPNVNTAAAAEQCDTLVAKYAITNPPVFARPALEEEFFRQARIDNRVFRPVVWISGLNGQGRRTLVKEAFRRIDANGLSVEVDISECSLPRQLVLRLESEAFHCSDERLREINSDPTTDTPDAVAAVLSRIRQSGRYTILRQQRIVEERVPLPEWVFDVARLVQPTARPAAFIISQVPVDAEALRVCGDHLGAVRVVSLLSYEAEEFAWSLVRHFDPHADRWSNDLVRRVSVESGGTPELMVSIIRLASRLADLEPVKAMLAREVARFSEALTNYVNWAVSQIAQHPDGLRVLRMLQDINPASIDILRDLIGSSSPIGPTVGALQSIGLVECTESGLYRLSPLLSRRLDRFLIEPKLLEWQERAMKRLLNTPQSAQDLEHGYLRIEAAIDIGLRYGGTSLPDNIREFVSAAHWFQAGVKLYAKRHFRDAHAVLKEAFKQRSKFQLPAQLEVCRYFGLAAVRAHSAEDIDVAINALRGMRGGSDLVEYLLGYRAEIDRRFIDAMHHYSEALRAAQSQRSREREARVLRPLINCILRSPQPNFDRAEQLAIRAVEINKTVFSLLNQAKVLVNRSYRDRYLDDIGKDAVWERYLVALEVLERDPGGAAAYAEIRAEEAQLTKDWSEAINWMDHAISVDSRFENRLRRWKIMVRSKDSALCGTVVEEIDRVFENPMFRPDVLIFKIHLIEAFAMAQKVLGRLESHRIDQYGQGLGGQVKAKIIRDVQRHEPEDTEFMGDVS